MKIEVVKDLSRRAGSNLRIAAYALQAGQYEECVEMSHNAAEKALKAILENYNIDYDLTHLVERLANAALPNVPKLKPIIDQLYTFDLDFMPSRYPSNKLVIKREDAERDYNIAKEICSISFEYLGLTIL